MDRRKFIRRSLLGGAVVGLGATNAIVLAVRKKKLPLPELPQARNSRRRALSPFGSSSESRQDDAICSIAFSSLGNHLAAGTNNDVFSIWDPETEGCLLMRPARHGSRLIGIGFCSDKSWLVTLSESRGVKFWKPGDWRETTFNAFDVEPTCAAFRPPLNDDAAKSTSLVAVALVDGSVRILEYDERKRAPLRTAAAAKPNDPTLAKAMFSLFTEVAVLKGHKDQVGAVSFSHDGKLLASASDDHTVGIWDANTWKLLATLRDHTSGVNSVSFSKDGRHLASGSADSSIIVWDRRTMTQSGILRGHTSSVINAVFSADSKWLASTSFDRKVLLWPMETGFGKSHQIFDNTGDYAAIDFSANGEFLASTWKNKVRFWRTSVIFAAAKGALKVT